MKKRQDRPESPTTVPDYGNRYRIPFTLMGTEYRDENSVLSHIVVVDPEDEYGMSRSLARLLQQHSRCVGCGRAPFPLDAHDHCKRKARFVKIENHRRYEDDGRKRWVLESIEEHESLCQVRLTLSGYDIVHEEERVDYQRENRFLRKKRRPKLPPEIVKQQKRELFALHDGHCYYCYGQIEPNGDSADFDHFNPIRHGGTGDLWNLVVSCKQCNHDKSTIPGKAFRARMLAPMDPRTRRALTALHVKVQAWHDKKRAEVTC